MNDKTQLRSEIKKLLGTFSQNDVKHNSSLVVQNFLKNLSNFQKNSDSKMVIGIYAPMKGEVDLISDMPEFFNGISFEFSFPYFDEHGMHFKKALIHELVESSHLKGVMISPAGSEEITPEILLIPGLAFDKLGGRLGRGKGYFDRYLEKFSGIKIGICFDQQVVTKVPTDHHDQKMDFIITDKRYFKMENI